MKMRLAKLNICPCGYSALNDEIGIGTTYTVFPDTIKSGFKWFCGGCKKTLTNVTCIKAEDREDPGEIPPGWLPLGLFEKS